MLLRLWNGWKTVSVEGTGMAAVRVASNFPNPVAGGGQREVGEWKVVQGVGALPFCTQGELSGGPTEVNAELRWSVVNGDQREKRELMASHGGEVSYLTLRSVGTASSSLSDRRISSKWPVGGGAMGDESTTAAVVGEEFDRRCRSVPILQKSPSIIQKFITLLNELQEF